MNKKFFIILKVLIILLGLLFCVRSFPVLEDFDDHVDVTTIILGVRTKIEGDNAVLKDGNIYINKGGEYNLKGILVNGTIYIDTASEVTLNFNGVTLVNEVNSIVDNRKSNKLIINVQDKTKNIFSDGSSSASAIKSIGDVYIMGYGCLLVYGNTGNGITITKGDLYINDVTLYVAAIKDAFKVDNIFGINSGIIIGLGNNLMQSPSKTSKQNTFLFNFDDTFLDKTNMALVRSDGEEIISFNALKKYKTLTLSVPELKQGSYYLLKNCAHTGKLVNGIYQNGSLSDGEKVKISIGDTFVVKNRNNWYGNIDIMNNSITEIEQFQ